jgi:hypothetical protein
MNRLRKGELAVASALLFDYINVTVGFRYLASQVAMTCKSVRRMFGTRAKPTVEGLFLVIKALERYERQRKLKARMRR